LSHSVEFAAEELAGYSAEFAAEELAGYSTECGSDPFMLHLCAALAEKQRAMISRRTKDALAV
jgi:DNA invertase Pin-like site-specific DNA recombinase